MEEIDNLNSSNSLLLDCSLEEQIRHLPIKRSFDVIFSALCLIIGFPVFLAIGLCIYFSSPGQIIYSHKRVGRGGKLFNCYKFRTMYTDADQKLKTLLSENPLLKQEWEKTFKLKSDPRITRIGAFLRQTSLDELPQFWNVIKGDLSVVGPRPVIQEEVDKYFGLKKYELLSVRPGLTGLWQVSGRSDIPCYQKRIELDTHYIRNRTFFLDLKIIAQTVFVMLGKKGAY